ncbi:MAG: gamma-glutamyltransferase [Abyssibacter sp.]|nr:gamma-glutamyltransferase [Abyssibacter sp.]MCK5858946.1 gamma-glutamyltransferase [Abyssibacter sp.]
MTSLPVSGGDRVTGQAFATRSEVIARHGMAATSQPLVTQIALDVLKAGGNAVDAAIAANAAQGLMEPVGNGIGGDLFAIVWDAESQALYGLNASGRSPRSLSLQWFADQGYETIPSYGPLPVSVPGCVDGWFELHARFGSRPMAELLDPAIRYAREGFPVTELIAYYWDRSVPRLSQFPGFTKQFTVDGRAPRKGEIWRNPFLANTLARIVGGGRDAFYEGAVAKTIADYVQAQGGFLSEADLAAHTSEWVEPVSTDYRGYRVWELPPNTQGVAALQMLNILEGFDLAAAGFGSPDHLHWFTEAKKLAFEDRARYYTDPDFADIPLERLLSKSYAAEQRARIDKGKAAKAYPDPASLQSGDTIYLTVADEAGNMVSLIQSNYRGMGSGMTPPGLGFILQNRGELFALDPTHANRFEPGKRPFHTIIPAFITHDGAPWVSFGLMGGAMQPQGHVQIVTNLIDFGMNLQEAGDAPRIYHEGSSSPTGPVMSDGGQLYLESGFDYSTVRALMGRGHRIGSARGPYGGYQAILRDPVSGVYFGASESRKDGQAAGY